MRIKNQTGFSLIEVIVAMSILLLLVTAFAPLINESFAQVFRAGRKSQAIQNIEDNLYDASDENDDDEEVEIIFEGGETIDVTGRILNIKSEFEEETTSITIFSPVGLD